MKKRPHSRHRKYINRNKPWNTRQHTVALTMKGAAFVILLALVAVAYMLVHHSNESLADAIVREEARARALEEDFKRETAKWDDERSSDKLRDRLLRNGIVMNVPSSRQRVAMRGGGARPAGAVAVTGTAYAANR